MKKITSLLLTALLLVTMIPFTSVPAFAETEPTEVVPQDGNIFITEGGNYIISKDLTVKHLITNTSDVTLTIAPNVTVTAKDCSANGTFYVRGTLVVDELNYSGKVCVYKGGNLIIKKDSQNYGGTIIYDYVEGAVHEHEYVRGFCTVCGARGVNPTWKSDGLTEVVPNGNGIYISNSGNYFIGKDCTLDRLFVGTPDMQGTSDVTLTIPPNVTVTVSENTHGFNNNTTTIVLGTLILQSGSLNGNNGTIRVGCGGKISGTGSSNLGTVEYDDEHTFDESGFCTVCGTFECELTGEHDYDNGICKNCRYIDKTLHQHHYNSEGTCTDAWCGYQCPHVEWKDGVCEECNYVCPHDDKTCLVCGKELHSSGSLNTGSALSEGSIAIITAVAGLAVGAVGMYLFMKKKKPALADDDE